MAVVDYDKLTEFFIDKIPHIKSMGMQIDSLAEGEAIVSVPYRPFMTGNTEHGLINGGVITSLIDTASGVAVCSAIDETERTATLDLRIDNLRPAVCGQTLYAKAECYRMTPQIVFVKALAYQNDIQCPVAMSQLTFIRKQAKDIVQNGG